MMKLKDKSMGWNVEVREKGIVKGMNRRCREKECVGE